MIFCLVKSKYKSNFNLLKPKFNVNKNSYSTAFVEQKKFIYNQGSGKGYRLLPIKNWNQFITHRNLSGKLLLQNKHIFTFNQRNYILLDNWSQLFVVAVLYSSKGYIIVIRMI